jgi:hypothetical protein
MSLEMAQKVIVPQKKNYVPQFLKQRVINSYYISQKKFAFAYAQSPRKCSNIEILAKIEGKEANFFSKNLRSAKKDLI